MNNTNKKRSVSMNSQINKISWKLLLITIGVIVAVIVCGMFAINTILNTAINYTEQITTAKSEIKIQEKLRADSLPNLANCIKSYNKYEYETIISAIKARNISSDKDVKEVQTMINAVAEKYPELKSNKNYEKYMEQLCTAENKIANARTNYNIWVTKYNYHCDGFPRKQILNMMGYKKKIFEKINFDVSEDAPIELLDD